MSARAILAGLAFLAAVGLAVAAGEDQSQAVKERANQLMQRETVLAVTSLTDPSKFAPDNDPNTLQIVYIADPKAGTNHVSDDGEVVWFFGEVNVNDQQPYIFRAFEIKAKRQLGIK